MTPGCTSRSGPPGTWATRPLSLAALCSLVSEFPVARSKRATTARDLLTPRSEAQRSNLSRSLGYSPMFTTFCFSDTPRPYTIAYP